MSETGYIKLYRQLREWGWYGDVNTKAVFLELLLTARFEDTEYMGVKVPRGSVVISINSLSLTLNLSKQQVRTALNHLKSTQEITQTTYAKFSVISINNYEKYQSDNTVVNTQSTHKQHASNTQATPYKERKKVRKKELNNINCNFDLEKAAHMAACGELKVNKKGAS